MRLIRRAAIPCLLLELAAHVAAAPPATYGELMEQAKKAQKDKRFPEACALYERARKEFKEAIASYERARDIDEVPAKTVAVCWYHIARTHQASGKGRLTRAAYRSCLPCPAQRSP